jgi:hypothetical protein
VRSSPWLVHPKPDLEVVILPACPVCLGMGAIPRRPAASGAAACAMCGGRGRVAHDLLGPFELLRDQMQALVGLMQNGDAEGASRAARIAVRLARPLLADPQPSTPAADSGPEA